MWLRQCRPGSRRPDSFAEVAGEVVPLRRQRSRNAGHERARARARDPRRPEDPQCAAGNHVGEFRAATCGSRHRRGGQFFHDEALQPDDPQGRDHAAHAPRAELAKEASDDLRLPWARNFLIAIPFEVLGFIRRRGVGELSMRVAYFVASRGETPAAALRPAQEKRGRVFAALIASLGLMVASSASRALELPKPEPVAKYLGKAATGTNYTVNPIVRSDGFDVDTPYGNFAFDGIEFAKLRIHELNAI